MEFLLCFTWFYHRSWNYRMCTIIAIVICYSAINKIVHEWEFQNDTNQQSTDYLSNYFLKNKKIADYTRVRIRVLLFPGRLNFF